MKILSRYNKRRNGSVLPLFALTVTMLLGATALAVDYGVLLSDRNQLQRACDAAALAGAGYLKRSDDTTDKARAIEQALLVAGLNNLAPSEMTAANVTFPDPNNTKIQVVATRARSLFFARIFGISQGTIRAAATAVVSPAAGPPVPIAITKVSADRYQNSGSWHDFTLIRPQDSAFATNYSGITAFDPFMVFDLSPSQSKTRIKMENQLAGDLNNPVNPQIGELLTGFALNIDPLITSFKTGISPRFAKAAGSPWLDPPVNPFSSANSWQLVGTRFADVLGGSIAPSNPRIVRFVVLDEVATPVSNYNYPIVGFATAYIRSVQDVSGRLTFTARFLPPGSGDSSGGVALIN